MPPHDTPFVVMPVWGGVDSRPNEILGVLYQHQTTQEHYILVERRIDPSGVGEQMWRVCGRARARDSDREAIVPCSVQVIAVLFLDRCCLLFVCVLKRDFFVQLEFCSSQILVLFSGRHGNASCLGR